MAKLEEIIKDAWVRGIIPEGIVKIERADFIGENSLEVFYSDDKNGMGKSLLSRDQEHKYFIEGKSRGFSFDSDGAFFKLAAESKRIGLAHIFDPYLAVHTSLVDPLPHQIKAVYGEMLARQPLRFLLADDPGAGKTIMAGLLIKELMARGDVERCMIVVPGNLVINWQDELASKFHLDFEIMTNDQLQATSGNYFEEHNLIIVRLDKMSRDEDLQEQLKFSDWDLVIVDEAHKMSASIWGGEIKETKRFKLGKNLGGRSRHLLLMTATPHNGKDEDFQLFMGLLDGDRFEGRFRDSVHVSDYTDLYRKTFKEDMLTFEGKKLFPKRNASTINYNLSQAEAELYSDVTEYVREQFDRAEKLENDKRKGTVGFALTVLQRRLASSPEAIYQSLKRRRERLENRLKEEELKKRSKGSTLRDSDFIRPIHSDIELSEEEFESLEDSPSEELETMEEKIVDQATTAQTVEELKTEIKFLVSLEGDAKKVRLSNTDTKWEQLRNLLHDDNSMYDESLRRRKLIIFTEHKDTLYYLENKIKSFLGRPEAVITIKGGMHRNERRNAEIAFNQDEKVEILVATDAACEGVNLHHNCHLMINYDLPWNPNRMEQRFGRVHRIGQKSECHLWNLVASETREGNVFDTLFSKLENVRATLGDRVFDVLGEVFQGAELRKLLLESIRSGEKLENNPELSERLLKSLDVDAIKTLLEERALEGVHLATSDVQEIRLRMERAEARKLQPHYISSFFVSAFKELGGKLKEKEPERFQIHRVPVEVRRRDRIIGTRASLREDYTRVTFQKHLAQVDYGPGAEFICPGHPLLDCTRELIEDKYGSLLRQGSVLVDDQDDGESPRVLVFLEHSILDGKRTKQGTFRTVSKQLQFVEIQEDGTIKVAGHAPYLDYRPLEVHEEENVQDVLKSDWLCNDLESIAKKAAIEHIVGGHYSEVKDRKDAFIEKTKEEVHRRLTQEINYWDKEAKRAKDKEEAGKKVRKTSKYCRKKADTLSDRLHHRMNDLKEEGELRNEPPLLIGAALVIPTGYFKAKDSGDKATFNADAQARREIEIKAMEAVMTAEKDLGFAPLDVSSKNKGWDIESVHPETNEIRLIEVKGKSKSSPTVTITRNEILQAKNNPSKFILAIYLIDENKSSLHYVKGAFVDADIGTFGFDVTSVNFPVKKLIENAESPSEI